ncbi:MAG: zinc ribbon domain-containing protein [Myxococcales bacterium]|nr:zinc ribbon domain-containing protein [Myxococcales bacterium]
MQRTICPHCRQDVMAPDAEGALCPACGRPLSLGLRCPWCLERNPGGRFCRACGCELPSPEQFGAARMLKDAGVDRFVLADRLRQMDPEQTAVLSRRFEQQRAAVMVRVEEARFCEKFLLQRAFSGPLEEAWLARLPLPPEALASLTAGPRGPFVEPADLERIFRESPLEENRALAALALFRRGSGDAAVFRRVREALYDPGALGLEAALSLVRLQMLVPHLRPRLEPRDFVTAAGQARAALARPELRLPAAQVVAIEHKLHRRWPLAAEKAQEGEPDPARLLDILNEGLSHSDQELSLVCAVLLGDTGRLLPELSSEDPVRRDAARLALLERGVFLERVLPSLTTEPSEKRRSWLRHVPLPLAPEPLAAVLAEAERGDERHLAEVLRWLRQHAAADYPAESREKLAHWLDADRAARLSPTEILDALAWLAKPPRDPQTPWVRPIPLSCGPVRALLPRATEALLRCPAEALPRLPSECSEGLSAWLWGEDSPMMRAALDRWAGDPGANRALFEFLSAMESRLDDGVQPPVRNWQILMGIWERCPYESRPALAAAVAAGWSFSYSQDEEGARQALRERYRQHPEERACLKIAFAGLLGRTGTDWKTFHDEVAPEEPRGGPDTLRAFAELCRAAPGELYHHVDWLLADLLPDTTPAFAERLFEELKGRKDSSTQLLPPAVALARWLDEKRERFSDARLRAEVLRVFREGWQAVLERCTRSADGAVEYYQQEKKQEIAEILARLAG